jgi:hypothetical protein
MKYLSILRTSEKYPANLPAPTFEEAMGEFIARKRKAGALVDTGGLAPSDKGFRMRVAGRTLITTEGPSTDEPRVIAGWAIMKADSREEILRLTAEFLELYRTHWPEFEVECEVRPIEFLLSDTDSTT